MVHPRSAAADFGASPFVSAMLAVFALAGLLLAVSAVYTVVSAGIRRQTPELANRLAFGGPPSAILAYVLGLAGRILVVGLPSGIGIALVALPSLRSITGAAANNWESWILAALVVSIPTLAVEPPARAPCPQP